MQDRWLVQETGTKLRVGVIDGCTPWKTEPYPGKDAAAWAAQTVSHYCGLEVTLQEALEWAHKALHNPALDISRRQAMACAAVVDCRIERGQIDYTGIVAGDCELWSVAQPGEQPLLVAGGQSLTDDALAQWLKNRHPGETADERREREAHAFNNEDSWARPALGRYAAAKYTQAVGRGHTVILASDGAKLSEAFLSGVSPEELSHWLKTACAEDARDDITCAVISAE